eukprot:TRINITY_DN13818_c0_g1_i2.p1 TRINITY_DN13818_c0_g1~~TRINITY_DN13818_c0_g1_i2.p1  ORF type:complete len:138 (-),score=37.44 TRINITY_DN13818_c0_g1_i2:596-1009(-)
MLPKETLRDANIILSVYKTEGDGLTEEEMERLVVGYQQRDDSIPAEVVGILSKYDTKGELDLEHLSPLVEGTQVVGDLRKVIKNFDSDCDGKLSQEEVVLLVKQYEEHEPGTEALRRWDINNDGKLDEVSSSPSCDL